MNYKKYYIFITNGISELGGVELYLVNKIQWLEKEGWEVHVFSAHFSFGHYKVPQLRKYRKENMPPLSYPPYAYSKKNVSKIISIFKRHFKEKPNETIIESHSGSTSLWGELFAKELRARHHIEFLHEYFKEECYLTAKNFFVYKLNRHEIYCGNNSKKELIQNILNEDPNKAVQNVIQYNPILDVDCKKLNQIQKADYTICYIGRTDKPYFLPIVSDVSKFALKYKDSLVQFVVIGKRRKQEIMHFFRKNDNVRLIEFGEMFPIPKKLYGYVDCICAGAGSARCSVIEGKPVIVPNPNTLFANGVLGYDTNESVALDSKCIPLSFFDAFESVLIRKDYTKKKFSYPTQLSVDECCKRNIELIYKNVFDYKYFSQEEMLNYVVTNKYMFKAWMDFMFPAIVSIRNTLLIFVKQVALRISKKKDSDLTNESK